MLSTYYNMGVALKAQGKLDEAIEAYREIYLHLSLIMLKLTTIWVLLSKLKVSVMKL